ncbi:MAG: hypothetical protein KF740_07815 [Ramlibacter sp.]|nr:hypothetical protein [Ramlibacter sp.]
MKSSLRKTPVALQVAFKYGSASDALSGCHFTLDEEGAELTLTVDLTPNFRTRDRNAAAYVDAVMLVREFHKLKHVQCHDNLLRARLVRAWERHRNPSLRLALDLGQRGKLLYAVVPRSLLMGGVQLDVLSVLEVADRQRSGRGFGASGFRSSGFQPSGLSL